jgi:hypothetical protein
VKMIRINVSNVTWVQVCSECVCFRNKITSNNIFSFILTLLAIVAFAGKRNSRTMFPACLPQYDINMM